MSVRRIVSEVPPWLDPQSDAPAELRALLEEGGVLPDDSARVGRLRVRLEPWLAVGATAGALEGARQLAGHTSGSVAPAAGVGVAGKLVAVLVGAGVAISAAVMGLPGSSDAPSKPASTRLADRPVRAAGPAASAIPLPSAEANGVVRERAPAPLPKQATRPPASSARAPALSAANADSLSEQAALLSRARRSIDSDPGAALRLLDEHAQRFPSSVLAEERSLFKIRALSRAGRPSEAQQELQRLEADAPSSPHVVGARRAISGSAREP